MTLPDSDRREMGFYFALSQVGFEMVIPMVLGLLVDFWLGWLPWLTIAGTVFGFVGGFVHMMFMLNKHDREERERHGSGKSS